MSGHRQIPGFYYDTGRNRYFRIQPNHHVPEGTAYSRGAVNTKEQADEIKEKARVKLSRDQRGRIARLNPTSYTGLNLDLRLGASTKRNLESLAKYYAASISYRSAATQNGESVESITVSHTGEIYAVLTRGLRGSVYSLTNINASETLSWDLYAGGATERTQSVVLDSYFAAYISSSLFIGKMDAPFNAPAEMFNTRETIWDMSYPKQRRHTLALAGENGLWVIPDVQDASPVRCKSLLTEQMVVDFRDPFTIMSGSRNGTINFTDYRAPSTVARLRHSSAVTGISNTNNVNELIVSGMNTTALYDLRYSKAINLLAGKKRKKHAAVAPATKPMVSFHVPEDRKSIHYATGKCLAYVSAHNTAVVVSHRGRHSSDLITLYDVSTGRIRPSSLTNDHTWGPIKDIAVSRVRDGPESILVSTANSIHEYGPHLADESRRDVAMLKHDRFPQGHKSGMAELWARGDGFPG